MAALWKGTPQEKYTVPLLAMLLVENGAMNEAVRGDHGYAIGLDQTHICIRGFHGKKYCGAGAESRLAASLKDTEWHDWLTSWRTQFRYYTVTVEGMVNEGYNADGIIKSWNSREVGRRDKVRRNEAFVREALGI